MISNIGVSMKIVRIHSWNYGFEKVNFTELLMSECGLTLKPAKSITDKILEGEIVEIQLSDEQPYNVIEKMKQLGVNLDIVVES
jgi:hypothetical protein